MAVGTSGRAKFSRSAAVTRLRLPRDYEDLLREFTNAGVEYLLVGGWAVAVHGYARATDDMDVFVRATEENSKKVFTALQQFGAPLGAQEVSAGLFAREQYGYRMGRKPLLIEILTKIDGVTFEEATIDAVAADLGEFSVPVIGLPALLRNKRAAGRPKDLLDVEALEGNE